VTEIKAKVLAEIIDATIEGDGETLIGSCASIDQAGPGSITFFANIAYASMLPDCRASALITFGKMEEFQGVQLIVGNPKEAFAKILNVFHPPLEHSPGIGPGALVDETASIDPTATISPGAYIGPGAEIGPRTVIHPLVYIGHNVRVGADCELHANVSVREGSRLGNHIILHNGAVVGSDGFGFIQSGRNLKFPQVGIVVIEDDVEIGANSTIDRAAMGETVIRKGVKIDNLVQVAHACIIGENTVLCGQVGIAGSTEIGKNCILAGQVGVADHVKIADNVLVGARSGIGKNITEAGAIQGDPIMAVPKWFKIKALLVKLPEIWSRLRALERHTGIKSAGKSK
jgi:UDP-3-O-[3-hydroxymyristoyl] glucosamine N-acyltransferase